MMQSFNFNEDGSVKTTKQQKQDAANAQDNTPQEKPPQEKPPVEEKKQAYKQPTVKDRDGNDVPFYPASVGHASDSVTRNAVKAQQQSRDRNKDVGLPDAAQPIDESKVSYVPMPVGGLHNLVSQKWPSDILNQEAFDQHLFDLMTLNRDTLRDDTSYQVGQMVRVPK